MARVIFDPQGAWDPLRGRPAENAQLTFFAIEDVEQMTPLLTFNQIGQPSAIVTTDKGWIGEFQLDGLPAEATQARWVAGEWSGVVKSSEAEADLIRKVRDELAARGIENDALVASAVAAQQAAEVAASEAAAAVGAELLDEAQSAVTASAAARDAAQSAYQLAQEIADTVQNPLPTGTPGYFYAVGDDGKPTTAPPPVGGFDQVQLESYLSTNPPSPAPHSHPLSQVRKADGTTPLAAPVVSLLNATDQAQARSAIGATNLTLGTGSDQAMPGSRTFNANQIALASTIPGNGGATTTQESLANLAPRVNALESRPIGVEGNTQHYYWNATAGAWDRDPTNPPAGTKGRIFHGNTWTGATIAGIYDEAMVAV